MLQANLYVLLSEINTPPNLFTTDHQGQLTLGSIAEVIASAPHWNDFDTPSLIVRSQPSPLLGIMGYFGEAQQTSISAQTHQMSQMFNRLQYVGYHQAEKDCEQLATQLIKQYGKEALKEFSFAGIPRGGLIVLGMLAYCLNLTPSQLAPNPDSPLVVVDDCSISGLRFGQFLETCPNERVIFAPLYSHPTLRENIISRESRVEACLSAHDLQDFAPSYYQDDYQAWLERWRARSNGKQYWIGLPDYICFAWNEPDSSIWNPVTDSEELGWQIIPDEFCLKNRMRKREPIATIQHQPVAQGQLKPTEHVLFGELDEQIIVANIESGANLSLTDVGADMWRAIIKSADLEHAVLSLLDIYEIDEAILKADLDEFVVSMIEFGLLEE